MPILIISDLVVRINASTTHASRWRERLSRDLTFASPSMGATPSSTTMARTQPPGQLISRACRIQRFEATTSLLPVPRDSSGRK